MRFISWIFVPLLFAASAAGAQSLPDLPDGPVSRAQLQPIERRLFDAMDTNHDGVIDNAEFTKYRQQVAASPNGDPFTRVGGHWFEHADKAGDGRVTYAEVDTLVSKMFNEADLNHNGVISNSERKFAMKILKRKGK